MIKRNFIYLSILFSSFLYSNNSYNPLSVKTYVLNNGLTVYINEDHNTTSVFGAIAVRGGGKRDPKEATGIAHYLEHLLFKGTEEMGTTNYNLEKTYLDSIEKKYDELALTTNEDERLQIQTDINRLSVKASEYAIPNEFDRLIEGMGGSWINAFTSNDAIVYLNKFPPDQIEKWLEVYSHRFINPVFRLFQSELETVYEEKNRSMDNPFGQAFETYGSYFFKNHPYGQQTILGSIEHLKNPSLSRMKEYFDTYYIANNMALILTGDINADQILPLIKAKFESWNSGDIPPPIDITEADFNGREFVEQNITPVKMGIMGYRTVPSGHEDEIVLNLAAQLLTNESKTGLMDYLQINGLIQDVGIYNMNSVDHGGANFYFFPLYGGLQTLDEAESLIKKEIEKLKNGNFGQKLLDAVKLTMIRQHETNIESMEGRLFSLIDVYINNSKWDNIVSWPERLNNITKDDIVSIANEYFGDNYLSFHSNEGSLEKPKLEKPPFEPVSPKNSEGISEFAKRLEQIPESELNIQFIEFDKDVQYSEISNRIHLYHTANPINSIFNLTLQYGVGTIVSPELTQTAEILNLLGTNQYSFNEFKSRLQEIGTTITFSSESNYFTIKIKGFDKYFNQSIAYLNQFIKDVKPDDDKVAVLIENAKSGRKIEQEDPSTIGRAINDFAKYGDKSPYLTRQTIENIEKSTADDYIKSFKSAMKYELDILYTGRISIEDVENSIKSTFTFPRWPTKSKSPVDRKIKPVYKNTIYLINDSTAIQSQIYFSILGNPINERLRPQSKAYNQYFSGGMSSIVFQEIREFRSLAYSAWAYFNRPWYNGNKGHLMGYVGCQTDKTIDAISVFKDITMNIPEYPERIDQVKAALIKSINSKRPNFRSYPQIIRRWKKTGYSDDPRKNQVNYFQTMKFNDIIDFQKNNIAGKNMTISIFTDTSRINLQELKSYGKIIFLEKEDVIN